MTPSLTSDLTELERLLEKATQGVWRAELRPSRSWHVRGDRCPGIKGNSGHVCFTGATYSDPGTALSADNIALIVALKNAAPSLITAARERDELKAERDEARRKMAALESEDWFDEVADFLDQYQDAEIIDGTTHPNKAMRLFCQLHEVGL
jgi:hypothetical protein